MTGAGPRAPPAARREESERIRSVTTEQMTPPGNNARLLPARDLGPGRGPQWLDDYLAARLPDLVAMRRNVHAHPELSRTESATSALILRSLHGAGIPATLMSTGTGVVAEIGSGDRLIALRADIDALPLRETSGLPF